jgi:RNA polymerase sigma-70 factor (ECF subfamily)
MRRFDFGRLGMVGLEVSTSPDDAPLARFEELAMPLLGPLFNLARWLVHNQNDAEDLVQETYLKALRHFNSFQPGTNFRAWMYRILRNTFLTSRASVQAGGNVPLDSEEDGSELAIEHETPETILVQRYNAQLLQSAIEDLPVRYKMVLLLCDVEEMSYREIAGILSIPIGTVMSRLARARKMVRGSLGSIPDGPLSRKSSDLIETHDKAGEGSFVGSCSVISASAIPVLLVCAHFWGHLFNHLWELGGLQLF